MKSRFWRWTSLGRNQHRWSRRACLQTDGAADGARAREEAAGSRVACSSRIACSQSQSRNLNWSGSSRRAWASRLRSPRKTTKAASPAIRKRARALRGALARSVSSDAPSWSPSRRPSRSQLHRRELRPDRVRIAGLRQLQRVHDDSHSHRRREGELRKTTRSQKMRLRAEVRPEAGPHDKVVGWTCDVG